MTVERNSSKANEFSIGLIACSRHQSGSYLPWAQHRPNINFASEVVDTSTDYLVENLGYGERRDARVYYRFWDSEQWTGHTALLARRKGIAVWATGWVPKKEVLATLKAMIGATVPGEWQNDLPMLDDPTSISLEFPVAPEIINDFIRFWKTQSAGIANYCFEGHAGQDANCAWSAVTILRDFLDANLGHVAHGLAKVTSPRQGTLMGQIAGGELLQP
jgi:hypothetical protein